MNYRKKAGVIVYINYESRVLKRGDIYYVGREGEGQPAVLITSDEVLSSSPEYVSVVFISGSEAKLRKCSPFYVKIDKTGRPAVIECDNQNQVESLYVRQHIATLDATELSLMNEALIRYQALSVQDKDEVKKLRSELNDSKKLNEKLLDILEMRGKGHAANYHQTKSYGKRARVSEPATGI